MEMQVLKVRDLEAALSRHALEPPAHFVFLFLAAEKDHRPGFARGAEPVAQAGRDRNRQLQRNRRFAAATIPGKDHGVIGGGASLVSAPASPEAPAPPPP